MLAAEELKNSSYILTVHFVTEKRIALEQEIETVSFARYVMNYPVGQLILFVLFEEI
jgi:hypothetical protein